MKTLKHNWLTRLFLITCFVFLCNQGLADDTCMFMVTADDVPPNIVILLDNGAEMEQIAWHSDYDNSVDYTPSVGSEVDVVENGGTGNGFFNDNGYTLVKNFGYELVKIQDDLTPATKNTGFINNAGTSTFLLNGRTVFLPYAPSTVAVDGVIDNATLFRYSKNYLNWLFFYTAAADLDGDGSSEPIYDGSTLPNKSRFYYAKKAIFNVAKLTSNKANFGIYNFTSNADGASNVQPLGMVVNTPLAALPENNTLQSNFINNVNNMGTVTYSPLAEGLARVGGYYASSSSHVLGYYCQKSFVIVVTPGMSSEDQAAAAQSEPGTLSDDDGDDSGIGEGNVTEDNTNDGVDNDGDSTTDEADEAVTYAIPTNQNGSTYLDDVAYYLYTHDIPQYSGAEGFQNVMTYTIGFMGDEIGNLFLINTSNNGNGNLNLYDTNDPEYGKYHYEAEDPDQLSSTLLAAINDILSANSTFTAPVVPVTRTTSGNRIYMAFFKPNEGNFWEGNVTKFGISSDNRIVDPSGNDATWPNGAIKEDATPYWQTKDWADPNKTNYMDNETGNPSGDSRNIYTYLGSSTDLADTTNAFVTSNAGLTAAILGNPTHTTAQIINYVRGADVFDSDSDSDTTENRPVITGDVLHSEPLVVYYDASTTMVYFGANDGMLHAVSDSDGTEAWAFIPPDQLNRLKDIIEGAGHQYFVDSSPKAYIHDHNGDGEIHSIDNDQVILVCGERKGGTSYFALDVTTPSSPEFLWRINQTDDAAAGNAPAAATPTVIPELGQSWSESQFGLVKTFAGDTTGTAVMFIGGGYTSDNSLGKAVLAINVLTGAVVKTFKNDGVDVTDMDYSIPSSVCALDTDNNGFVDKVYVGDLGSQMWRFGKFTDFIGDPLGFPNTDENIANWEAQVLFLSDAMHTRKFFYPPSVTLEKGYDLVFMGTGDREDACATTSSERIYCVKDVHTSTTLEESDLVDVTDPATAAPNMSSDQGWYIQLAAGEKVLAEGLIFYKAFYVTTFTPNNDPCLPGGVGKMYALGHLTGRAVLTFGGTDLTRSVAVGGGIPSKPVMVITAEGTQKLFVSVGSTNPDASSQSFAAGIVAIDPLAPPLNFFYLWWKELIG
jgi:type IV pilus assembly protein PilY1